MPNFTASQFFAGTIAVIGLGLGTWGSMVILSIDPSSRLRTCNLLDRAPKIAYHITQAGSPFDIQKPKIEEMETDQAYPDGNSAKLIALATVNNPITPIDINFDLKPPSNQRDTVRVVVVLEDASMTFNATNRYAITSVSPNKVMFCVRSFTGTKAIFDVKYFTGGGPSEDAKLGSFNINLLVPDVATGLKWPFSLDPEVRNHG